MKILLASILTLFVASCSSIGGGVTTKHQDLEKSPCACIDEIHYIGINTNKVV